jgi:hypothetical protein
MHVTALSKYVEPVVHYTSRQLLINSVRQPKEAGKPYEPLCLKTKQDFFLTSSHTSILNTA